MKQGELRFDRLRKHCCVFEPLSARFSRGVRRKLIAHHAASVSEPAAVAAGNASTVGSAIFLRAR